MASNIFKRARDLYDWAHFIDAFRHAAEPYLPVSVVTALVSALAGASHATGYEVTLMAVGSFLAVQTIGILRALKRQATDQLSVYLNAKNEGVQTGETETRTLPPKPGPLSKWVQIEVAAKTDIAVENCEVRIVAVERIRGADSDTLLNEPVWCTWSDHKREIKSIPIPPNVPVRANLFSLFDETNPSLHIEMEPIKITLRNEIQKPGSYRILARVTGKGARTVSKTFLLKWEGSFDNITIKDEGDIV